MGEILFDAEKIQKQGGTSMETRFRRKDGQLIDIAISLVFFDSSRLEGAYIVSITDITLRKQVEANLRQEKELTDTIINSLPGVFYILDEKGRYRRWNQNTEKVAGYTAKEFAHLNPLNLFEGEDRRIITQAIREALCSLEHVNVGLAV